MTRRSMISQMSTNRPAADIVIFGASGDLARRKVLPALGALQFVCERALDTGVTTSLAIDPHGKTLSYALLEMTIET